MKTISLFLFLLLGLQAVITSCSTAPTLKPPANLATQEDTTQQETPFLNYSLEYSRCNALPCLKMTLEFQGNTSGSSRIRLPNHSSGQKDLWKSIQNLKPITLGLEITSTKEEHIKDISFPKGQKIKLSYEVIQDFKGEIQGQETYYRAIIQPDYFFTLGDEILVYPAIDTDHQFHISFNWVNPPKVFGNSYGMVKRKQDLNATFADFRHGIFLGGDYKLSKLSIHHRTIYIATQGKFSFTPSQFSSMLKRIFTVQREFWNDHDFPFFLVSAIKVKEDSMGGTGRTNAFSLFMQGKTKADQKLTHLLSHELFHTWNGRRIQRTDPEELVYWFSEGFTNYYARLLSFRGGLIDLKEYLREYNDKIFTYYTSAARNEKVERVLKDFWNNMAVEKLPYYQGDLLAHRWNKMIRDHTSGKSSIDDFMRDLLKIARTEKTLLSPELVDRLMKKYLPLGIKDDHQKFILDGGTIPIDEGALGSCVKLVHVIKYPFYLGIDKEASRPDKILRGVDPEGPAYAAGFRNGMKLTGWSISSSDGTAEFSYLDGKVEKTVALVPHGKPVEVPQYELDLAQYKANPNKCEQYLR